MEGFQLSSYFMLWLHHQNPQMGPQLLHEQLAGKGKEIERENSEEEVLEKGDQKNQDTLEKS